MMTLEKHQLGIVQIVPPFSGGVFVDLPEFQNAITAAAADLKRTLGCDHIQIIDFVPANSLEEKFSFI